MRAELLRQVGLDAPPWIRWLRPYAEGRADEKEHVKTILRHRRR